MIAVLVIESDAGTQKQNQPIQIQPDKQQYTYGKTGVDGVVFCRIHHKRGKQQARALPTGSRNNATREGTDEIDSRVGHQHVKESECANDHQERHDFAERKYQGTKRFDGDQTLYQLRTHGAGGHAQRRHHQSRPDQNHAQIVTEALTQ